MSAKYAFIAGEEGNYPIYKMCVWAKVSRAGFYEWRDRAPSATAVRRERLAALVKFAFEHSDGTSGYRRIHAQLRRWGHYYDDETIRSVMRELGLVACQPRPFRPITTIAGDASAVPDLVRRDFTATAPGRKLVGDITYIPTWEGWLYLATVLDCFSKKVVGYAMADHMRTSLVTQALQMAANNVGFTAGETIFHSDYAEVFAKPRTHDMACTDRVPQRTPRPNVSVFGGENPPRPYVCGRRRLWKRAEVQSHGPLPASHPAGGHHATPRPRERFHHRSVLRLRNPGHDPRSHQRRHPRNQHSTNGAVHRRPIAGPPDVVVGGGEGWQHAYPRGDLVGERVRRQVDEVVSERSE